MASVRVQLPLHRRNELVVLGGHIRSESLNNGAVAADEKLLEPRGPVACGLGPAARMPREHVSTPDPGVVIAEAMVARAT
jgi:hypothetical protein